MGSGCNANGTELRSAARGHALRGGGVVIDDDAFGKIRMVREDGTGSVGWKF